MSIYWYHYTGNLLRKSPLVKIWIQSLCVRMEEINESKLPKELLKCKPLEPKPEDCCGDGCKVCVYDLYDQEIKIWKNECYSYMGYSTVENSSSDEVDWMSPLCYTICTLKNIKFLTRNCNIYRFKLPENVNLDLKQGEHLVMRGCVKDETITRQYTPVSSEKKAFDVLIKVYKHGLLSQFISMWSEGSQVEWRGPFGSFSYTKNAHSKLLLLAAGTGIAPMIQVIQSILDEETDETRVHLCFCCQTYDDILLKEKLNFWKQYWNFQVTFYLSQETDHTKIKYGDDVILGQLKKSDIQNHVTDSAKTRILICGTNSFNTGIKEQLKDLGFPSDNTHIF